ENKSPWEASTRSLRIARRFLLPAIVNHSPYEASRSPRMTGQDWESSIGPPGSPFLLPRLIPPEIG
ncbi:hypothetical protein BHM03_00059911, partial [Ensete ventricosum]